jgi:PilZ domain
MPGLSGQGASAHLNVQRPVRIGSRIRAVTVKEYQSRPFRAALDLPVRFFSTDGLVTGHCRNVSASGMLVEFDKPVSVWEIGELTIRLEEQVINIGVRVARVHGREAGVWFYIEGDNDRVAIGRLMYFAAEHQPA